MAVINTIKVLQANVQHWLTNKISFYNSIRTVDLDILLFNERGVRNIGKSKCMAKKQDGKIQQPSQRWSSNSHKEKY